MAKLVVGKNDLAMLHPEVAAEADGWDPKNVHSGSHSKMSWKCKKVVLGQHRLSIVLPVKVVVLIA